MYKNKKVAAIIVAAGSSSRMGGIDKQYLILSGEPVLAHSVRIFQQNEYVDEIVAVVRAGEEERFRTEISDRYGFDKVKAVVQGGAERPQSVINGIDAVFAYSGPGNIDTNIDSSDYILLIHDGARPFTDQATVNAVTAGACEYGAAVPCVRLRDTVKTTVIDSEGREFAAGTPDRSSFRAVQTPQGFEADVLMEAYRLYSGSGSGDIAQSAQSVTDDASLVELNGGRVLLVPGSESNVKITTPHDLELYGLRKR